MKVLWLHNHYRVWGGESAAAEREARLLGAQPGVRVVQEAAHNDAITQMGAAARLWLPVRNAWSQSSYRRVRALCREHRPDVLHAHNLWPLLSPSVFAAARTEGVPTVFTAHNFYLFCLNGVFFRDGHVCTDCKGGLPWRGVVHRCYRGVTGSATRLAGTALHRALRTFHRVDRILVPSEFARAQFLEAGFAADRVRCKWLSCEAPSADAAPPAQPPEFLVACRLVPEKGVHVAIAALQRARRPWRLVVAGDGPELSRLRELAAPLCDRVRFLGRVEPERLQSHVARATAVLAPSLWFETFGLTAIEAFAAGRPVVASRIGALPEIVVESAGVCVPPGDANALAITLDVLAADPALGRRLGAAARRHYEQHFTPARDAARLLAHYADVCGRAAVAAPHQPRIERPVP